MNADAAKENANPTVHEVRKRPTLRLDHADSFGYDAIQRYARAGGDDGDGGGGGGGGGDSFYNSHTTTYYYGSIPTAGERSVYMALKEIYNEGKGGSKNKHTTKKKKNKGNDKYDYVRILRDAGFFLSNSKKETNNSNEAQTKAVAIGALSGVTKAAIAKPPFIIPASAKVRRYHGSFERMSTEKKLQEKKDEAEADDDSYNPVVSQQLSSRKKRDPFDEEEIFDMIRTINDPEHPLTLEQLRVVNEEDIVVYDQLAEQTLSSEDEGEGKSDDEEEEDNHDDASDVNNSLAKKKKKNFSSVEVQFTPTIPHCSMATLIGLCIRVKLQRSLPARFKVTVKIKPGTHASEIAVNKQLCDKERVAAALENAHLLGVVNKCVGRLD